MVRQARLEARVGSQRRAAALTRKQRDQRVCTQNNQLPRFDAAAECPIVVVHDHLVVLRVGQDVDRLVDQPVKAVDSVLLA